ncbi:hypothetical protein [Dokdonella soli]|uniref:DUF2934 domain-containing protein n=1 Tax=Dokdonella soli TaxID=529810 RepID=A0ABN1IIK5_9GAMM
MVRVIEMPVERLSDHELGIRQWEAVMSCGYGSPEHQWLEREILRRTPSQNGEKKGK